MLSKLIDRLMDAEPLCTERNLGNQFQFKRTFQNYNKNISRMKRNKKP